MSSEAKNDHPSLRDKIIGLGERSIRKSYYPQLQQELAKAEKSRLYLQEKSAALLNMLEDLEEARRKLAASEAQLRAVVETTPDCILLMAADGAVLEVNAAGLRMIECESAELIIGRQFDPLIVPEFREAFRSFSERVLRGAQCILQFEVVGLKGTRRWLESHAVPLRSPSDGAPSLLAVIRDITERKQAEEALRINGGKLKEAQRMAHLGYWQWDVKTGRVEWSEEVFNIFRLDPKSFTPHIDSILDLSPWPEEHNRGKELLERLIDTHDNGTYEQRFLRPDGSIGHYQSTYEGRYDEEGNLTTIVGTVLDTTEKKRAEEELRISERRFRMAQAIGHVGNWEYDVQTAEFWGSDEAKRLYGFDVQQSSFTTEEVESCVPERERVHQALTGLIEAGKPYNLEFEIHPRNSAEPRIIASVAEVSRDEHGAPLTVMGVVQDVTQRKRAEEEIRRLNRELEQRVRDRTAQLEAANKELEAFAYSVSHDLRAPLRHIDGFVGLLQERTATTLDQRSQHYMATIAEAAKRMGTLIDDLLSFSRMGRQEMLTVPFELGVLVQEVVRQLEPDDRGRDVRWHIADLPVITGDPALLRQVLVNLLSNALKFTRPRQQAEITIGCLPGKENETVVFVRDNGVGFDETYAKKLFGVFQRLHSAEEFEGSGIGLANVRRIVGRHGGNTWAEGAVNHGATFYFSLPQALRDA